MSRHPWLRRRKKTDPELPAEPPLWFGNRSNGEYYQPQTPRDRLARKLVLARAEERARKLGIDRREFLASSMGMFTTLAVLNELSGCGGDGQIFRDRDGGDSAAGRAGDAGRFGAGPWDGQGPYVVPPEATCEEADLLSGDEFIFDLQTHSFDDGEWREKNATYRSFLGLFATCGAPEPLDCFDRAHYAELIFLDSDTSLAVISSWPAITCTTDRAKACGLPLSNEGMRDLRDWLNTKAMSERVVNQCQVMPNDRLDLQKEIMQKVVEDPAWRCVGWKAYPAWVSDTYRVDGRPSAYFLSDDIGLEFIEHGLSLGVPNFAVHKGLPITGFDVAHNVPSDIGPVAKQYPEANFIVYHSGISSGCSSGCGANLERAAFDPDAAEHRGVDALIKTVVDNELGPGSNVYAELGSAWSNVLSDGVAAQHFIGKLLKYVGEDNVVWGTDAIVTGGPHGQIEAFRAFTITSEFQDKYGYPALTPAVKKKIFGLNAAKIHRVDPEAARCRLDASALARLKRDVDGELGPRRWTAKPPLGPRTRREFVALARRNLARGIPG